MRETQPYGRGRGTRRPGWEYQPPVLAEVHSTTGMPTFKSSTGRGKPKQNAVPTRTTNIHTSGYETYAVPKREPEPTREYDVEDDYELVGKSKPRQRVYLDEHGRKFMYVDENLSEPKTKEVLRSEPKPLAPLKPVGPEPVSLAKHRRGTAIPADTHKPRYSRTKKTSTKVTPTITTVPIAAPILTATDIAIPATPTTHLPLKTKPTTVTPSAPPPYEPDVTSSLMEHCKASLKEYTGDTGYINTVLKVFEAKKLDEEPVLEEMECLRLWSVKKDHHRAVETKNLFMELEKLISLSESNFIDILGYLGDTISLIMSKDPTFKLTLDLVLMNLQQAKHLVSNRLSATKQMLDRSGILPVEFLQIADQVQRRCWQREKNLLQKNQPSASKTFVWFEPITIMDQFSPVMLSKLKAKPTTETASTTTATTATTKPIDHDSTITLSMPASMPITYEYKETDKPTRDSVSTSIQMIITPESTTKTSIPLATDVVVSTIPTEEKHQELKQEQDIPTIPLKDILTFTDNPVSPVEPVEEKHET
jgi:hypothetical protein